MHSNACQALISARIWTIQHDVNAVLATHAANWLDVDGHSCNTAEAAVTASLCLAA